LKLNYMPRDN